jgi:hypothetical protein
MTAKRKSKEAVASSPTMKVTAKQQKGGDETLWFQPPTDDRLGCWGVFSHRPGSDALSLTVADRDDARQLHVYWSREDLRKLMPFLQRFAEGGNMGIDGLTEL